MRHKFATINDNFNYTISNNMNRNNLNVNSNLVKTSILTAKT